MDVAYLSSSHFSDLLDRVCAALPAGVPAFLVGGAVRDMLLGKPTHDLDIALDGDALKIAVRVADKLGGAYFPLDEEHGAGRVVWIDEDNQRYFLDFTSFRGPNLEADLKGRDFTINALALDLYQAQTLIDPLGGARDLREKRIRTCSTASFENDPLRILRAIRLAASLQFKIMPQTRLLMEAAEPDLDQVSPERMRDELFRILEGPRTSPAMQLLERFLVLPHLLPELGETRGIEQSPPHTADVWTHTLRTLQQLETLLFVLSPVHDPEEGANLIVGLAAGQLGRYRQQIHDHIQTHLTPNRPLRPLLFLAALYHDAGKPPTMEVDVSGRIRFYEHPRVGAEIVHLRGHQLRLSNQEIQRLVTIVRHHMRPMLLTHQHPPPSRRAIYRFFRDTGPAGIDICLLSLADTLATYGPGIPQEIWRDHLAVVRALLEAWWENRETQVEPPPLITGKDLIQALGVPPGPQIGDLLRAVQEAQAIGEIQSREEALALARELLEES